jgi:hypothetical protein
MADPELQEFCAKVELNRGRFRPGRKLICDDTAIRCALDRGRGRD